jgi:hypothetical protein
LAFRFLAFCDAFAFARCRALAFVMFSSPLQKAWWNFDDLIFQGLKLLLGR